MSRGDFSRRISHGRKSLGREIGGGIGRKLKEILSGPQGFAAFDGDGDGFITGPNGEDKFPTPLKLESDRVKSKPLQIRKEAMVDFARSQLEAGTPTDSPAALNKFFNLQSERAVIDALQAAVPDYISQHEFFRAAMNSEIAKAVVSMPDKTSGEIAKRLGISESMVDSIRRSFGTRQQWRVAPDFDMPAEATVKFAGRRMLPQQRQSLIDRINRSRRNGVADAIIAQDVRLSPGDFALALQEMEQNGALEPQQPGEVIARNLAIRGYIETQGVERIAQLSGLTEEATRLILGAAGFELPAQVRKGPEITAATPIDEIIRMSGDVNAPVPGGDPALRVLMRGGTAEDDISLLKMSPTVTPADMSDDFDVRGAAEGLTGGRRFWRSVHGWLLERFPEWSALPNPNKYKSINDLNTDWRNTAMTRSAGDRLAARELGKIDRSVVHRGLMALGKLLYAPYQRSEISAIERVGAAYHTYVGLDSSGFSSGASLGARAVEIAMGYEPSRPMRLSNLVAAAVGFFGDRRKGDFRKTPVSGMSLTFSHVDENGNFSPRQMIGVVGRSGEGASMYIPYVGEAPYIEDQVESDEIILDDFSPPILRDILFIPIDRNQKLPDVILPSQDPYRDNMGPILKSAIDRSMLDADESESAKTVVDLFIGKWMELIGSTHTEVTQNNDNKDDRTDEIKEKAEELRKELSELGKRFRKEVLAKIPLDVLIEAADESALRFTDFDSNSAADNAEYSTDGRGTPARFFSEMLRTMVGIGPYSRDDDARAASGMTALDAYDLTDDFIELAQRAASEIYDNLDDDDDLKGLRHMMISVATGALSSVGISDSRRREILDTMQRAGYSMHVVAHDVEGVPHGSADYTPPPEIPGVHNPIESRAALLWVHEQSLQAVRDAEPGSDDAVDAATSLIYRAERISNPVRYSQSRQVEMGEKPTQNAPWKPVFVKPNEHRKASYTNNTPDIPVTPTEEGKQNATPYGSVNDVPVGSAGAIFFPVTYDDFLSEQSSPFDIMASSSLTNQDWVRDSGTVRSLLIGMIAKDLYGTGGSLSERNLTELRDRGIPTSVDELRSTMPEVYEVLAAQARGIYETTQEMFESLGITHLYMWRGQRVNPDSAVFDGIKDYTYNPRWDRYDAEYAGEDGMIEFEGGNGANPPVIIGVPGRSKPIGSWAVDFKTAAPFAPGIDFMGSGSDFNDMPDGSSMVVAIVPVDQIFGTGLTGYGNPGEYEVVSFPPEGEYPIAVMPVKIKGNIYNTRADENATTERALAELLAAHGVESFDSEDILDKLNDRTPSKEERRNRRRRRREERERQREAAARNREAWRQEVSRRLMERQLQAREQDVAEGFESDEKSADYTKKKRPLSRLEPIPNMLESLDLDDEFGENWIKRPERKGNRSALRVRRGAKMLPVEPITARLMQSMLKKQ